MRSSRSDKRGLARHFEGWQPGLVAVLIAGGTALVVVPRPVEPTELPRPMLDHRALRDGFEADEARADEAERGGLDHDVREVGTAIRAYGRADRAEDAVALGRTKEQAARAAMRATVTPGQLQRLRAFQQRSFLREVRRWEATGVESDELTELGGGFTLMIARNGWCEGEGCREVAMSEAARRASFKKRWNEIVGRPLPELSVPVDEQKALVAFLIDRPVALGGPTTGSPLYDAAARTLEEQFRLRKIDELGGLDPAYPSDLARGVVLYRLGRYPLAVEAFRRHLDAAPDGPHTLRAQNHLRAALERAMDDDGAH